MPKLLEKKDSFSLDSKDFEALNWGLFAKIFSGWSGMVMALAGIVCFFAYNWAEMHKFTKLSLLASAFIFSAFWALIKGFKSFSGRLSLFFCGLLAGSLMALYGQIYQTGADTWELFASWALFMGFLGIVSLNIENIVASWILASLALGLFIELHTGNFLSSTGFIPPLPLWLILSFVIWELLAFCIGKKEKLHNELKIIFKNKFIPYISASLFLIISTIICLFTTSHTAFYDLFLWGKEIFLSVLLMHFIFMVPASLWDLFKHKSVFVSSLSFLSLMALSLQFYFINFGYTTLSLLLAAPLIIFLAVLGIKLILKYQGRAIGLAHKSNKKTVTNLFQFSLFFATGQYKKIRAKQEKPVPFVLRLVGGASIWIALPILISGISSALYSFYIPDLKTFLVAGLIVYIVALICSRSMNEFFIQITSVLALTASCLIILGLAFIFDELSIKLFFPIVFFVFLFGGLTLRNNFMKFISGILCPLNLYIFCSLYFYGEYQDVWPTIALGQSHYFIYALYLVIFCVPVYFAGSKFSKLSYGHPGHIPFSHNLLMEKTSHHARSLSAWLYGNLTCLAFIAFMGALLQDPVFLIDLRELYLSFGYFNALCLATAAAFVLSVYLLIIDLEICLKNKIIFLLAALGLSYLLFKYPWALMGLCGIILSRKRGSALMFNLMLAYLISSLIYAYYDLSISLLDKSLSLMTTGAVLLALAYIFHYFSQKRCEDLNISYTKVNNFLMGGIDDRCYISHAGGERSPLAKEDLPTLKDNKIMNFKAPVFIKNSKPQRSLYFLVGFLIFIALFSKEITDKEKILSSGTPALFELMPVDPRSLMQGDYMVLRLKAEDYIYHDYFQESDKTKYFLEDKAVIKIDKNTKVASFVRLHKGEKLASDESLIRFKIWPQTPLTRIGSGAFFFQEGKGIELEKSRYALFRISEDGTSLITDLLEKPEDLGL